MDDLSKALIRRSLNEYRLAHLPTYIALRLFASRQSQHVESSWTNAIITRKLLTNNQWAYHKYPIYKGVRDGKLTYRQCVSGSPITILAESLILRRFAQDPIFQVPQFVYSYLWPTEFGRDKRVFKYYWKGYLARVDQITNTIRTDNHDGVLVMDLRDFYPTCDRIKIHHSLESLIKQSSMIEDKGKLLTFFDYAMDQCDSGIPIGTSTGHFLGQIAMREFDSAMHDKFGFCYTRYVDDISITCNSKEVDSIKQFVVEKLKLYILPELNKSKTHFVPADEWDNNLAVNKRPESNAVTFESIMRNLSVLISFREDVYETVKRMAIEAGYAMPWERIEVVHKKSLFAKLSYRNARYSVAKWMLAVKLSPNKIITEMELLKKSLTAVLDQPSDPKQIASELGNKARAKEINYTLGRLLYLLPSNEYWRITQTASQQPETIPIAKIATAIVTSNPSLVTEFPGNIVNTFCEVFKSRGGSIIRDGFNINVTNSNEVESAASLLLHGLVNKEHLSIEGTLNDHVHDYTDFAGFSKINVRKRIDFSYIDELRTLQLGLDGSSLTAILRSRFDEDEDMSFSAQRLGSGRSLS